MTTRVEFDDFVRSFNKNKGEYTREEVLEIARLHSQLHPSDRNWNALANQLGLGITGKSLRQRVYRDRKFDYEVTQVANHSSRDQFEELYKAKTTVRDYLNDYRRELRTEARLEELGNNISDSIKALDSLPTVKFGLTKTNLETEAVLLYGDLHIGAEVDNSYNKYNLEIAAERLSKLATEVIANCHRNNVKVLNFLNMGDLIAGAIHPTLRLTQSMNVMDQVMKASELTAQLLNQLQAAAPTVVYRSVTDNHSRLIPNYKENLESENLNRLIDWYLQARLKDTGIIFKDDNLDIGVGHFTLMNGKTVTFTHGHQDKKSTVVQDVMGLTREFPDIICMAHYHNSAEHSFQGSKLFICGSIIGTDYFAYNHRLFGDPEQKLLIFNGSSTLDIDINLK